MFSNLSKAFVMAFQAVAIYLIVGVLTAAVKAVASKIKN